MSKNDKFPDLTDVSPYKLDDITVQKKLSDELQYKIEEHR